MSDAELPDAPCGPRRYVAGRRWRKLAYLAAGGWRPLWPCRAARPLPWSDHGPVPRAAERCTPQGLAWVAGRLIFANSWHDCRSRVYEIEPETMARRRWFDMPPEAVHTSGLTWDGTLLWSVDYISNRCYALDLEASLQTRRAVVVHEFDTGLQGTSACCLVPWEGALRLAVSDFMHSARTVFLDHVAAARAGSARGCVVWAYRHEGFSQGLEFIDGRLYESENKLGGDVLHELDLAALRRTGTTRGGLLRRWRAPGRGVEDLAWDGRRLWTSDECAFRFYATELPPRDSQGGPDF